LDFKVIAVSSEEYVQEELLKRGFPPLQVPPCLC